MASTLVLDPTPSILKGSFDLRDFMMDSFEGPLDGTPGEPFGDGAYDDPYGTFGNSFSLAAGLEGWVPGLPAPGGDFSFEVGSEARLENHRRHQEKLLECGPSDDRGGSCEICPGERIL